MSIRQKKKGEGSLGASKLNSFVSPYLGDFEMPVHPRGCQILDLYKLTSFLSLKN